MGFEFLAPYVGKLLFLLGAIAAAFGVYWKIRHGAKVEERNAQAARTAEAEREQREKLDAARGLDRQIDAEAARRIDAIRPPEPPTTPTPPKPGEPFRF